RFPQAPSPALDPRVGAVVALERATALGLHGLDPEALVITVVGEAAVGYRELVEREEGTGRPDAQLLVLEPMEVRDSRELAACLERLDKRRKGRLSLAGDPEIRPQREHQLSRHHAEAC